MKGLRVEVQVNMYKKEKLFYGEQVEGHLE